MYCYAHTLAKLFAVLNYKDIDYIVIVGVHQSVQFAFLRVSNIFININIQPYQIRGN